MRLSLEKPGEMTENDTKQAVPGTILDGKTSER